MSMHEYSKLRENNEEGFEVDDGPASRCTDRVHSSTFRGLKVAVATLTCLLALSLIAITVLVSRLPSSTDCQGTTLSASLSSQYRSTTLGRDSRYMTRNHAADALWEVMLEDHLGEYSTPDGPFDRGEFSIYAASPGSVWLYSKRAKERTSAWTSVTITGHTV
ncbi:uncharacterized protein AB675_10615 [Cyphellophora attinorum]|uniref:Uncharacterized protein n=1 Tax=Cyphellophora attinorum TaxID=1664694 RepID=A0A0N1H9Y9_9EURO|nr:uncharacterized protein AB675_10615 [Phialophora attinorum]KPI40634.1 hypothetical protein AB675_10615 [Phialophora attinorum]